MGSVVGVRRSKSNGKDADVVETGNAKGDVAPLLNKKSLKSEMLDNIGSPRPRNNETEMMEMTEVTSMGDVPSVRNEVSLLSNSSAFTEGTLSPNPVTAWVQRDIYEMYGAFDARNKPPPRVIYLPEEKGHENRHPTEKWNVDHTHLGEGSVHRQELRKEEQELLRREQELKDRQLLQTQLRQQQLLQQELRKQELLAQELQQQEREQEELILQELEEHDEMVEQEVKIKQPENPPTRVADAELVAPSVKIVSKLKAEEKLTLLDTLVPIDLVHGPNTQRVDRLDFLERLERLEREEADDYRTKRGRLERRRDVTGRSPLMAPSNRLRPSRASSTSSSAPFSSSSNVSSRSVTSTPSSLLPPPTSEVSYTAVTRLMNHDFDPDKFKAANCKFQNGVNKSESFGWATSCEDKQSRVSSNKGTIIMYDSEDEELIDSIVKEYEEKKGVDTPWLP